jgi:hypothetical protein
MQHHQFECIGLDEYADIQEEIHSLLYRSFFYYDYPFMQAVEEAVVNAAQHSVDAYRARILIVMRVMTRNIAVTVACQTKVFNAIAFQQKLKQLMNDPVTKEMDWGAYIRQTDAAAGIWYMLTGSEYLCMDARGQSVTIVTRRAQPIQIDTLETRIGLLAPRFLVQQDGVIFS